MDLHHRIHCQWCIPHNADHHILAEREYEQAAEYHRLYKKYSKQILALIRIVTEENTALCCACQCESFNNDAYLHCSCASRQIKGGSHRAADGGTHLPSRPHCSSPSQYIDCWRLKDKIALSSRTLLQSAFLEQLNSKI